jgi:DNA gyrase subunit B
MYRQSLLRLHSFNPPHLKAFVVLMAFYRSTQLKLDESSVHGIDSGAELFLVEGDSAAASVCGIRNQQLQAVLAMQGKPLNALKASSTKVVENVLFKRLSKALAVDLIDDGSQVGLALTERLANLRFSKVILLFDPDADGIHCNALMQMFFYRWMRPLLEAGRIEAVHFSLDEIKAYRPRGLGSLAPEKLHRECIDPATRHTRTITVSSAQAAISVFGR